MPLPEDAPVEILMKQQLGGMHWRYGFHTYIPEAPSAAALARDTKVWECRCKWADPSLVEEGGNTVKRCRAAIESWVRCDNALY